jgi:DNA polymerase-3 subunit epsilon
LTTIDAAETTAAPPWHHGRLAVFDTETTSPDPETARIVTASFAYVGGSQATQVSTWLIDPGVDIPVEATAVHGITTEHAREHGTAPEETIPAIAATLAEAWEAGLPVVGYNATFDLTTLDRDLARHTGQRLTVGGPVVDPYVIDRQIDKYRRGKRTLGAACAHYGVALDGAHDATADAIAAGRVAWAICQRYPQIAAMPLPDLHAAQAGWHAERQADFAAYLRRVGKPADDVCGDWPLRGPRP